MTITFPARLLAVPTSTLPHRPQRGAIVSVGGLTSLTRQSPVFPLLTASMTALHPRRPNPAIQPLLLRHTVGDTLVGLSMRAADRGTMCDRRGWSIRSLVGSGLEKLCEQN